MNSRMFQQIVPLLIVMALPYLAHGATEIGESPKVSSLNAWVPCDFDIGGESEALLLASLISERGTTQGYDWHLYIDRVKDESIGDCTRANWDALPNSAGVLLMSTHGDTGNIGGAFSTDAATLETWRNGSGNMFVEHFLPIQGVYWVRVKREWFVGPHWSLKLNTNRAVTYLGSCHSADDEANETTILGTFGGQVRFGYRRDVRGPAIQDHVRKLFGRMNGTIDNGTNRIAQKAFAAVEARKGTMDYWVGLVPPVMYDGGDFVTLCPSCNGFYPDDGITKSLTGTAFVSLDTYCDNSVDPTTALTVDSTSGVVKISDLRWVQSVEDPLGRCRQLHFVYEYKGNLCFPAFTVTATAHAQYIRSEGSGGQKMDGNRIAPNGDDKTLTFSYQAP